MSDQTTAPIPMRLTCPTCNALHIDVGEFATKPHHTHACQECGAVWRPAVVPTVGVRFLPGFKNEPEKETTVAKPTVNDELFALGKALEARVVNLRESLKTVAKELSDCADYGEGFARSASSGRLSGNKQDKFNGYRDLARLYAKVADAKPEGSS